MSADEKADALHDDLQRLTKALYELSRRVDRIDATAKENGRTLAAMIAGAMALKKTDH